MTKSLMKLMHRSPLKYPGAKIKVIPRILKLLPKKQIPVFIDCFAGGGSCFLNVNAARTIAFDINWDLINFYKQVQQHGIAYIHDAKQYFTPLHNLSDSYYEIRQLFNDSNDSYQRAIYILRLAVQLYTGSTDFGVLISPTCITFQRAPTPHPISLNKNCYFS